MGGGGGGDGGDPNTAAITKEGHKRLHLLQKLRSFDLDPTVLKLFHNSFTDPNLPQGITGVLTKQWTHSRTC